jgi:hypothetical protein
MLATLLLAVTDDEPSKASFYILAALLILFAVGLTVVGTARHENFPPSEGAARAIIGVCALLVAGTMVTAVITA